MNGLSGGPADIGTSNARSSLMRKSLAWAAERLEARRSDEQDELLDRIEKLAAMVRYGMICSARTRAAQPPRHDGLNIRRPSQEMRSPRFVLDSAARADTI